MDALTESLYAEVEASTRDTAHLRVLSDQVQGAPIDPSDKNELLGRISTYLADDQKEREEQ